MDNKDLFQEEEFSLEDILSEFSDAPEGMDDLELSREVDDMFPVLAESPAEVSAPAAPESEAPAEVAAAEPDPQPVQPIHPIQPVQTPEAPAVTDDTQVLPETEKKLPVQDAPVSQEKTQRLEYLSDLQQEEPPQEAPAEPEPVEVKEEAPKKTPIPFNHRTKILEMKKKLVAGPEKRYYDLTEIGVGKLQLAILLNLIIVLLCVAATTMHYLGMVPDSRMKLLIFSQVLALLGSGVLGSYLMMDGIAALFRGRFTLNMLLLLTFLACLADGVYCLKELRIPCCAAFSVETTLALWAEYHRRSTEMSQMDTLRKAVKLNSIVKMPDFFNGKNAFLKGDGDVDDFMDTYKKSTAPEKLQSVYAFLSMILCLGIATVAGLRHSPSLAVQVLANALLAAVPASFFVTLTRPMSILQKRLHMVGSVLCGWQGVRKLCGKAIVPLNDEDLFPKGSIKINGVKYYGDRNPEDVIAYATSLIAASGGGLVSVFRKLLAERGGKELPVASFRDYGNGGIGGEIGGEPVLLGSLDFLQDMGVDIPAGTMVNQAVYAAIDGQLSAVIATSYAKMRSASAGMVSLFGSHRLTPVLLASNFMLNPEFLRSKFSVRTRRLVCPDRDTRTTLSSLQADPEADVLALTTRDDLLSTVYAITGARALRTSCNWGMAVHMLGSMLGMLIMLALAYLGNTELLTPIHVLLYQAIWMIPGLLVTEWTRTV